MKNVPNLFIYTIAALLLSSCTVSHKAEKYKVPHIESWKEKKALDTNTRYFHKFVPVKTNYETAITPWWKVFQDKQLNYLQLLAINSNHDIKYAFHQYEERAAIFRVNKADRFPFIDLRLSASRNKISKAQLTSSQLPQNALLPPIPPFTTSSTKVSLIPPKKGASTHKTILSVTPEIRWSLDLWGKYSQAAKSAQMILYAYKAHLHEVILDVTSKVATHYNALQALQREIEQLKLLIDTRRQLFKYYEARYKAGILSEYELNNEKILLAQLLQDRQNLERTSKEHEHALATLCAIPASTFQTIVAKQKKHKPILSYIAPVAVLQNRPDIQYHEYLIESARLDIGVAKTAYLPDLTIQALIGTEAHTFRQLIRWKNHIWALTASSLASLFDMGQKKASVEQAKARYNQAIELYLSKVLNAYNEVENALTQVHTADCKLKISFNEIKAAQQLIQITRCKFTNGIIDIRPHLESVLILIEAKRRYIQAIHEQNNAYVGYIKSVGGELSSYDHSIYK